MPARSDTKPPEYKLHKGTGQAYVNLNGDRVYLKKHGTPESEQEYRRVVGQWMLNGGKKPIQKHDAITIDEIAAHYLTTIDNENKYRKPDGTRSPRYGEVKVAIRQLCIEHGDMQAVQFTTGDLVYIRSRMKDQKLRIETINSRISTIKRVFKHAAAYELIPPGKYHSISELENIREEQAPELASKGVDSVPEEHIAAIEPYVPRPIWGLIQVQLLNGARPGELVGLRLSDIQRRPDGVWFVKLKHHKNAHRNKQRYIYFGQRCQEILQEFIDIGKPLDAPIFSSLEAKTQGRQNGNSPRRAAPTGSDRIPTGIYRVDSYRRAIRRACKIAGVPPWSPNQLRHNFATRISKELDNKSAQAVLGHTSIKTTLIYIDQNHAAAAEIMAAHG